MIVQDYQPQWPSEFRALREALRAHLGAHALEIHHVGSTAIPGMLAKPVLDVDVEIADDFPPASVTEKLREIGYVYEGERGITGRHSYRLAEACDPARMQHHLYVCASSSPELARHLNFRDSLVASAELREEYAAIKRHALDLAHGDRQHYVEQKEKLGAEFFARVLSLKPIAQRLNGAHDLVESAECALERGEIDEVEWHRRLAAVTTPAYLASDNPRGQSGYSGDDARWKLARSLIADGIDRDGTFLDVGCASGYLMESMQRWCGEKGIAIEPYGLNISPELEDLARRRLPRWADRIFTANALGWHPPRRFDFVRTGMYVPRGRRKDLIQHLLSEVVAPGGRLMIGVHNEPAASITEPTLRESAQSWGFAIAGQTERQHPLDSRVRYRVFWIDRAS